MSRGRKVFVVGIVAALTVPVVYVLTHPSAGEPLTAERLAEARKRWAERGPKSYVIEVDVRGLTYRIEVAPRSAPGEAPAEEVVSMTVDGRPAAASALEHWTVEGMFGFLAQELSNLRRVEAAYGVTDPDSVTLRAAFDRETGYPARFMRHVLGQNRSIEWRVLSLTPR